MSPAGLRFPEQDDLDLITKPRKNVEVAMNKRTLCHACRASSKLCREEDGSKLLIVQFTHPGSEYKKNVFKQNADKSLTKPWTALSCQDRQSHHRSFLQCEGAYRAVNGKAGSGSLNFWGEWEGPAEVKALGNAPQWLLTPRHPNKTETGMNTDPFVFNGPFRYSFCRQEHYVSLRKLAVGSMILFGSNKGEQFFLDTVFVVGKNCGTVESHSKNKALGLFGQMNINAILKETGVGTCGGKKCGKAPQTTVYEGATPESSVNGIYSFAPAKLASGNNSGSDRFVLDKALLGELITPTLRQGIKNTPASMTDIVNAWHKLTKALDDQMFVLGVRFDIKP